jgi:hypothetical protein
MLDAGVELGHDSLGAGSAVVDLEGAALALVVGVGVVVVVRARAVGAGTVEVGAVGLAVFVAVGEAVVDAVGEAVEVAVAPLLPTLKLARRLDVVPSAHVSTTLMVCVPSAIFAVSNGRAVPSSAVPARSKGGFLSV